MSLDRDTILAENLRQSLDLYQRSLVWAMTAAAAFFILTLSLGDPQYATVSVLYGRLSGPAAWFVAMALFFVLGILASSALLSAKTILKRFTATSEIVDAVLLYPSLATNANVLVRFGTAALPPIVVLIGFAIQVGREWPKAGGHDVQWWLSLALFVIVIAAPYLGIMNLISRLREQPNRAVQQAHS